MHETLVAVIFDALNDLFQEKMRTLLRQEFISTFNKVIQISAVAELK